MFFDYSLVFVLLFLFVTYGHVALLALLVIGLLASAEISCSCMLRVSIKSVKTIIDTILKLNDNLIIELVAISITHMCVL